MALASIYPIIFFFDPPNALTRSDPNIGEKTTGVRNETPNTPYFRQIKTNLLFLLVNTFLFLLNFDIIHRLNPRPKKEIILTVLIMPKTVNIMVSSNVKPTAVPIVGPPTNFNMLIKYTDMYLPNPENIPITRQQCKCNKCRSSLI